MNELQKFQQTQNEAFKSMVESVKAMLLLHDIDQCEQFIGQVLHRMMALNKEAGMVLNINYRKMGKLIDEFMAHDMDVAKMPTQPKPKQTPSELFAEKVMALPVPNLIGTVSVTGRYQVTGYIPGTEELATCVMSEVYFNSYITHCMKRGTLDKVTVMRGDESFDIVRECNMVTVVSANGVILHIPDLAEMNKRTREQTNHARKIKRDAANTSTHNTVNAVGRNELNAAIMELVESQSKPVTPPNDVIDVTVNNYLFSMNRKLLIATYPAVTKIKTYPTGKVVAVNGVGSELGLIARLSGINSTNLSAKFDVHTVNEIKM